MDSKEAHRIPLFPFPEAAHFPAVFPEQKEVYMEPSQSTTCGNAWRGQQLPLPPSLAMQHPCLIVFCLLPVTTWGIPRCKGVTARGSALAW